MPRPKPSLLRRAPWPNAPRTSAGLRVTLGVAGRVTLGVQPSASGRSTRRCCLPAPRACCSSTTSTRATSTCPATFCAVWRRALGCSATLHKPPGDTPLQQVTITNRKRRFTAALLLRWPLLPKSISRPSVLDWLLPKVIRIEGAIRLSRMAQAQGPSGRQQFAEYQGYESTAIKIRDRQRGASCPPCPVARGFLHSLLTG